MFLALSAGVHAGAFGALSRGPPKAEQLAFAPTPHLMAGDTLELDGLSSRDETPQADDGAWSPEEPVSAEDAPGDAKPASPRARARGAATASVALRPPLFGAVGVRYATDLATTFTRAFPQAASADAIWTATNPGSAGIALVALTLGDGGRIARAAIAGDPSPALRRGIDRTLALIAPRALTARETVTRLRVAARIARDERHDGLHGDVFALSGGSFSGALGTAFFTLPPSAGQSAGLRVDVDVRLVP